jgi:hypothetical protein
MPFQKGHPYGKRFKKGDIGEKCVNFRGNDVKKSTGNRRAWCWFKSRPCEECGAKPEEKRICRHHKDKNTLNNEVDNIQFLCASCHQALHMKNMSEETKDKIRNTLKGRKLSDEHKKNISLGLYKKL